MNIYTHYEQTAKVMNPHAAVTAAAALVDRNVRRCMVQAAKGLRRVYCTTSILFS